MLRRFVAGSPTRSLVASRLAVVRGFHVYPFAQNSVFGEVIKDSEGENASKDASKTKIEVGLSRGKNFTELETRRLEALSIAKENEAAPVELTAEEAKLKLKPEDDIALQEFLLEQVKEREILTVDELISPLKKTLYNKVVDQHGFFKNDQHIKLEDGSSYKLHLTREEIEVMEPSIYLKSNRIKSSIKKATQVNRLLNGMKLIDAINQCHFNRRKIARDIGELLDSGLRQAKAANLNVNNVYISQIFVGSDGNWGTLIDIKSRGKNGRITLPYVHVKVILKTEMTTNRLKYEKELKEELKKPWLQLDNSSPLRQKVNGIYKW